MMATRGSYLKALVLIAVGIVIGTAVPGPQPSAAKEVKKTEAPRIGYVNVAKVLRDYKWATGEGARIAKLREEYIAKVKTDRETLGKIQEQHNATVDPELKKALQQQAMTVQRQIEALDKEAQSKLTELSNKTIVTVYEHFREVFAAIAKEQGLDVVEGFPAASNPTDAMSPQVAQLMLQTPALIPFYINPEFDYTEEVIARLNRKYPAGE